MSDVMRNKVLEERAHKNKVFLAYSSEDSDTAAKWIRDLRREGVNIGYDEEIVNPGDNWEKALEEAISEARVVIWLLSSNSVISEPVYNEVSMAKDSGIAIVPVAIKGFNPIQELKDKKNFDWLMELDIEGTRGDEGPQTDSVLAKLKEIDPQLVAGVRIPILKWIGPIGLLAVVIGTLVIGHIMYGLVFTSPSMSGWFVSLGAALWFVLWWYNLKRRSDTKFSKLTEIATIEYDEPNAPVPVYANMITALVMLLLGVYALICIEVNPAVAIGVTVCHVVLIALFGPSVQQRFKVRLIPIGTLGILLLPVDAIKIVMSLPLGITLSMPSIYDLIQISGLFVLGLVLVYDIHHRNLGLAESQQPIWLLFLITTAFGALAYYSEAYSMLL